MPKRFRQAVFLMVLTMLFSVSVFAAPAKDDPARVATREKLRLLLSTEGPKIGVAFKQSEKEPFNFGGMMKTGLTNAEEFEIVVTVTPSSTIGFRVYPHYNGGYINVDKVGNPRGLMKKLLQFSGTNFLYWGADDTADVFCGYTITLESGFPAEVVDVVIRSIPNQDQYVGQLKPFLDDKPAI